MPIKIGEQMLVTSRPDDLDSKLVAATGCNAAENARMIRERPVPFAVARALAPLLDPALTVVDLAKLIGEVDPLAVAKDVASLLVPPAVDTAPVPLPNA